MCLLSLSDTLILFYLMMPSPSPSPPPFLSSVKYSVLSSFPTPSILYWIIIVNHFIQLITCIVSSSSSHSLGSSNRLTADAATSNIYHQQQGDDDEDNTGKVEEDIVVVFHFHFQEFSPLPPVHSTINCSHTTQHNTPQHQHQHQHQHQRRFMSLLLFNRGEVYVSMKNYHE